MISSEDIIVLCGIIQSPLRLTLQKRKSLCAASLRYSVFEAFLLLKYAIQASAIFVTGRTCSNDVKNLRIVFIFLSGIIQNKTTSTTKKIIYIKVLSIILNMIIYELI